MKRVVCLVLVLALVMSGSGLAQQAVQEAGADVATPAPSAVPLAEVAPPTEGAPPTEVVPSSEIVVPADHPLKTFVLANASSPDKVAAVQSSAARRWGKAALGAALGAVAGAVHAQLTGGDIGKEAVIGAIAGGAIGFAVTKIRDRRLASRSEVAAKVAYEPTQGYRTGIEGVTVSPANVPPGGTITVTTSYWALGPDSAQAVGMSRYAGIAISGAYLRGFSFKPDPMKFGDGGGQFETTIEIQLPPQVSPGEYSVVWLVDGNATNADGQATFLVSG